METIHIAAYSYFLDTIGMPESEYKAFLKYDAKRRKYEYMLEFEESKKHDEKHIAKTLAVFGTITEGLHQRTLMNLGNPYFERKQEGLLKGLT
ncbi:hypothetical protein X798_02568 [Onchocerca flexuosa]|uniref:Uncharacterized protein n=1 Tax=Onchocerca flexuosa TaxID=387005 RepID=A0A238BYC9_9BILA|nr:hypothetical protein X798_02568 [Onchocerca flexuosa]